MDQWPRKKWSRHAMATLAVGIAAAATYGLGDVLKYSRGLLFIAAVMVAALSMGLGPALLASALGAVAFYVFMPHVTGTGEYLLQVGAFVGVALVISWLSSARQASEESLRAAHAELETRVQERTAALDSTVLELRREVAERSRVEAEVHRGQDRLRSLANELSASEERERRRLAMTLHDGVGHRLAVAVIKLRGLLESTELDGSAAAIDRACQLVEEAIEHTRSLTLQLSPPILFELGLVPALEWLAVQIEADHGLHVDVADLGISVELSDERRAFLFGAARELLINVVKHAKAKNAWVTLQEEEGQLQLEIEDDGKGCDSGVLKAGSSTGFGLFNIRERLCSLQGNVDIAASAPGGCRLSLRIPIDSRPSTGGRSERQDPHR